MYYLLLSTTTMLARTRLEVTLYVQQIACLEGSLVLPLALSDNSSIKIEISTEHWWNYTDRATLKYFEEIKPCNVQCAVCTVAV